MLTKQLRRKLDREEAMVCIQCNGKGYVTGSDNTDRICPDCRGKGEDPAIKAPTLAVEGKKQ